MIILWRGKDTNWLHKALDGCLNSTQILLGFYKMMGKWTDNGLVQDWSEFFNSKHAATFYK
jgi:hypothetical protein